MTNPEGLAGRSAGAGRRGRAIAAIRAAAPTWPVALAGSAAWACLMAASAAGGVSLSGWQTTAKITEVTLVFAVGGFLAFPLGLIAAGLLSHNARPEPRFAAAFLALAFATIVLTAGVYAMQYRFYYARWHADAFTPTWMLQFLVTTMVAYLQFAVSGVRLYFPIGFLSLFIAAAWFARRPR